MAGIAGIVYSNPSNSMSLLSQIEASLCFHEGSTVESWNNDFAGLCRVKSGIDNPETQPIFNRAQTKCILMFGECFDYQDQKKDLRRRGYHFKYTENDPEFCLALFEEFGQNAFQKLSGSFVLAIYDLKTKELVIANDRLGSRPVFYGVRDDGTLIFSTQVSSILKDKNISRELDRSAVVEFVCLQRVLGSKTYHSGVRMLTPGSILRHSNSEIDVTPFWYPQYSTQPGTADEYAEELAYLMKRAMAQVTRGANKVATLLSGGLDSRMLVAATQNDLTCYAFGDYDNPEVQIARRIAKARGFHFNFMQRQPDHYFKETLINSHVGS